MRQLEALTGPDPFRDGLREYLKKYSFGNATWPDLITILGTHTKEDLAAFSHAWVDERGRPIIRQDAKFSSGRITRLSFTQQDPLTDRGLVWNQHILVAVGGDSVRTIPVALNAGHVDVPAARGLPASFVLANGGGIAYGEIHLDPASLAWLTANVATIPSELTRGSAWVTLWDAVLDGEVKPDAFIETALASLAHERNELITARILSYTRDAYWRFTAQDARLRLAPRLEAALRSGLDAAPAQTSKSVWFSALRDVAQTRPTLDWLARVWRHDEKVPGLTLAETDEIRLAEELAVRGLDGASTILDEQYARTKNPDRKAQFAFVRPALSADPAARDTWFGALADVANRRREPWVLEGLRYLHHPLRESSSEKYIEPSLMMLRDIQRSGDIFFPKRWMDATLGGHRSPAAAAIVRTFVDGLPQQYPLPLRRVIQSSADELFRASRLR